MPKEISVDVPTFRQAVYNIFDCVSKSSDDFKEIDKFVRNFCPISQEDEKKFLTSLKKVIEEEIRRNNNAK